MRKLLVFIQALFVYPFLAFPALAQTNVNPCATSNPFTNQICRLGNNIGGTIGNIVVAIIVIAVIIAILFLLWGSIRWIMSRGDKEAVEAARNHIIAAIVGLIVIFLAVFIVSLILSFFGLNLGQLAIPKIVP